MEITRNTTPYPAELFAFTDKHAQKHCVVVVKATFDVDASGRCTPADEQVPLVFADEHFGDPALTAIARESDFVPLKPRIDILVSAHAVSPNVHPVARMDVSLAWSGFVKQAIVTGDRQWLRRLGGFLSASQPRAFTQLPLTWDRAYGGMDQSDGEVPQHAAELRNPVGKGFYIKGRPSETVEGQPLPNIESPGQLIEVWSDRREPIGFGPIGRSWQPRVRFAGTYDQRWMDERLPFLPSDFDDRYFQSAPLDQQLPALKAGDAFLCINMNASGRFLVRTPAFNVPVRFELEQRTATQSIRPDTVILEPAKQKLILVGRARVPLPRKLTALREIHIGPRKRSHTPGKPHYSNLREAVLALRPRGKR
jgi:hypothetical protein